MNNKIKQFFIFLFLISFKLLSMDLEPTEICISSGDIRSFLDTSYYEELVTVDINFIQSDEDMECILRHLIKASPNLSVLRIHGSALSERNLEMILAVPNIGVELSYVRLRKNVASLIVASDKNIVLLEPQMSSDDWELMLNCSYKLSS